MNSLLAQFVGRSQLAMGWGFHLDAQGGLLLRLGNLVLEQRLLTRHIIERRLTATLVELLAPVEGVTAVIHALALLGPIARLPGYVQSFQLGL